MKYEVYAVVNHTGSVSGGHYTASVLSHEDGAWYEFDDANVYKVRVRLMRPVGRMFQTPPQKRTKVGFSLSF